MNLARSIESLAVFGSVSRGDFDEFSDKDILLAGNHDPRVENELCKAGYSTSTYSWQQLFAFSRDGSLFLQHLKQEGRIFIDREGKLGSLLRSYRPRSNYSDQLIENMELLESTAGTPVSGSAIGWAFDVLAVGFRNHAILWLAGNGKYVFSFPDLVAEVSSAHKLRPHEIQLLGHLRSHKYNYRSGGTSQPEVHDQLRQTQAVVDRIAGTQCLANTGSAESFARDQIRLASKSHHWYTRLRRLEGAYRAMGYTLATVDSPASKEIEAIFAKPSPYRGTGLASIEWVRTHVETAFSLWCSRT
ncbi:nucleotidyltransferase domain-containing protein [Variovorax sp. VNK109]|uniref:nucleotidyltransferase domain-containing protein n=1 Tax=Variovorax sp. VNK109 TaxID=3400919 RepID=UPI003C043991